MKRRYNPLRAKMDLTQQELAHFLEIPLSTVAMCESRKRTWPTKGLIRLAGLELAWGAAKNLPVEETSLVPELVEAIHKLKNRMKECLETAALLQKMLDAMKSLYPLLKTKERTLQLLSKPGTSSIYRGWIEIQQYKIGRPLAENSPAKQIMLEHQINTLRAEAAAAAATIERLEQQMEEAQPGAAGEKHLQRRQQQMEEARLDTAGGKTRKHSGHRYQTALPPAPPTETTASIFQSTNETPPILIFYPDHHVLSLTISKLFHVKQLNLKTTGKIQLQRREQQTQEVQHEDAGESEIDSEQRTQGQPFDAAGKKSRKHWGQQCQTALPPAAVETIESIQSTIETPPLLKLSPDPHLVSLTFSAVFHVKQSSLKTTGKFERKTLFSVHKFRPGRTGREHGTGYPGIKSSLNSRQERIKTSPGYPK